MAKTPRPRGRPPKNDADRSVTRNFTLAPDIDASLDYVVKAGKYPSRSAAVARLIAREAAVLRSITPAERRARRLGQLDDD